MGNLSFSNVMKDEILSQEQKDALLELWDEGVKNDKAPAIKDMIVAVFGEGKDGRGKEGKAVKAFLASLGHKPDTTEVYQKKRAPLTDAHKEFIKNNRNLMKSVEIARTLFSDPNLTNLSKEARAVDEYSETLGAGRYANQEKVPKEEWKAPNTIDRTIARVNKHFERGGGIDTSKITAMQKKDMAALMRFLSVFRFRSQINVYEDDVDRELFESTFIRHTFDKFDLLEEEVDQYIILAKEAVLEKRIQHRSEKLQSLMDEQTDSGDGEKAKVSMALAEMIGKITAEYNACIGRQDKLFNSLKQKRSDRMSKQIKENASVLNLLEYWKASKTRKELLDLADKRKEVLKEEADKLSSMDDIQARIIGISADEAING